MHTGISFVTHPARAVSDFQCMHVSIKRTTRTCLSASIATDRESHLILSTLEWLHSIVHTDSGDVLGDELLLTESVMQQYSQLRFTETHRIVAFALFLLLRNTATHSGGARSVRTAIALSPLDETRLSH